MNQRNGPNLKVIAFTAIAIIVVFIGLSILSSIWGAVNSRAEELVLLGQYPDMASAIGPAVIEVILVPIATAAFLGAVIVAFWKSISGAGGRL